MKKFLIVLLLLFLFISPARADTVDEINNEMDYSEIDEWMSENSAFSMTFTEYIEGLITGSEDFSVKGIMKSMMSSCVQGIEGELGVFSEMFVIIAMSAVFTVFSTAIKNSQIAEMGFYLTYMLSVNILVGIFRDMSLMSAELISMVSEFMNLLTPAYMMGMAFCTGSTSATAMYEISLLVIALAENIIIGFLLPLIDIYLMMIIVNHVTGKGMFTKMSELIFSAVKWVNKSMIAVVLGLSSVQSMISPGVDQVKRGLLTKASGMIPVIGNLVGGMTETVLGAGVVLKNVIGVAGVLAIAVLCIVPLAKIGLMQLAVRISGAVVEPVVYARLTDVIADTGKALSLLFETVAVAVLMFVLVIVILAVGTGL